MTRFQYWTLTIVAFVLSVMLIANYYLTVSNNSLSNKLTQDQSLVNKAQQLQPILDQLAKRVAKGSENDPRLNEILKRHGLQVTLDVSGGGKKSYP